MLKSVGTFAHPSEVFDKQGISFSTNDVSSRSSGFRKNKAPKKLRRTQSNEIETWRRRTSAQEQRVIDSFNEMLDQFVGPSNFTLDDDNEVLVGLQLNKEICPKESWRKKTSTQEQFAIDSFNQMLEEFSQDLCVTPNYEETAEENFFNSCVDGNSIIRSKSNKNTNLHPKDAVDKVEGKQSYQNETWRTKTSIQEQSVIDSLSDMLEVFSAEESMNPFDVILDEENAPTCTIEGIPNVGSRDNKVVNSIISSDPTKLLHANDIYQNEAQTDKPLIKSSSRDFTTLDEKRSPGTNTKNISNLNNLNTPSRKSEMHEVATNGPSIKIIKEFKENWDEDKLGHAVSCLRFNEGDDQKDLARVTRNTNHNPEELKERLTQSYNGKRSAKSQGSKNMVGGRKQLRHSTGQVPRIACEERSRYMIEVYMTNDNGEPVICKNSGTHDGNKRQ